jgi:hypothetical protein
MAATNGLWNKLVYYSFVVAGKAIKLTMAEYYRSLLLEDACCYLEPQNGQKEAAATLFERICKRHSLLPSERVLDEKVGKDETDEERWHIESRRFRSLILEESRHAIAEALHRRWNLSNFQNGLDLDVEFDKTIEEPEIEQEENDDNDEASADAARKKREERRGCRAIFEETDIKPTQFFTAQDRQTLLRPGTVVELHPVTRFKYSISYSEPLGIRCGQLEESRQCVQRKRRSFYIPTTPTPP